MWSEGGRQRGGSVTSTPVTATISKHIDCSLPRIINLNYGIQLGFRKMNLFNKGITKTLSIEVGQSLFIIFSV